METDKERKLRCLCTDISEYVEKNTNYLDDLCDCEPEDGVHQELCKTNLLRLDFEMFREKISQLRR